MKIALCQINTTVADFAGNRRRIESAARRALRRGASLAVFPELAACSYPPRDLLESPGFVEKNLETLEALAPLSREIPLVVGHAARNEAPQGKRFLNAVSLLSGGRVRHSASKRLLPTYDVFDETRYFASGPPGEPARFGDASLGLTICEDAWNDRSFWPRRLYPFDPVEEVVQAGADVILNVSASPFYLGKRGFREKMIRQSARRLGVPLVVVNQVGGNDELVFDGASFAVDASGDVRVRLKEFEEDLDLFDTEGGGEPASQVEGEPEAARKALVLGLADYVRKCGFREVVIGLSGGVDSALTAALAVEALGDPSRVHPVAMPSRYSSPQSLADAEALARNFGLSLITAPIDAVFQQYLDVTRDLFRGRPPDVAEENFQARIRGNLLMGLSNKFGWLVLSTGNKSEMAVGYCTLYGDMSGGLAVLGDVPKTLVYDIARLWGDRIPPSVIDRPPSAELRPGQTDQDTLPPYEELDAVLKAYVEDRASPEAIAADLGLDPQAVERVVGMVDRNEYKRRQAAPVLKITTKAFGSGRRLPIARHFDRGGERRGGEGRAR